MREPATRPRSDGPAGFAGIGIDYLAENTGSGYGEAAEDYMAALRAAGVPLRWTPLEWGSRAWGPEHNVAPGAGGPDGTRHADICNVAIAHDTTVVHSPPVWYASWSQDRAHHRYIAQTTWETDRLPPAKAEALNHYDAVLVPSRHNRDAFLTSGVTAPITIVPHIARPARHVPRGRFHAVSGDAFVFYAIGPWTTRKALAETIEAYVQAFTAADPVLLVVKTSVLDQIAVAQIHRGDRRRRNDYDGLTWWSLAHLLAGRPDLPRIRLVADQLPRHEIDELHARGDCFVSLSRAEGWGLGAAEATAHGNPIVMTGWGGQRDFLGPDHPYYVDYRLVDATEDEIDDWYIPHPSERWARPDVAHASTLLRQVYEQRVHARAHAAELQRSILARFSPEMVGAQLLAALG